MSSSTLRRVARPALVVATSVVLVGAGFSTVPAVAAPGPDLRVASVSTPKSKVEKGSTLRVKVKVRNAGNRPARASRTRFLLSKNKRLDRRDRALTTVRTKRLPGKRGRVLTRNVRIPASTPTGTWHLLVCADATSRVRETREKNNCRATKRRVQVTAPRPDLTVTAVSARTARVVAGSSVQVEATVRNQGKSAAKVSTTRFHLSSNKVLDPGDHALGGRSTRRLTKGKAAKVTGSFTVGSTVPTGSYHLLACADAGKKVTEANEKNNCRASGGKITVARPSGGSGLVFPLAAKPLDVTYESEQVAQRSRFESVDGVFRTVYAATGSDGTQYELAVPTAAIDGERSVVNIELRPITSISGSPLGDQIGAVEILPRGLVLREAATLTITPTEEITAAPVPFKFAPGGKDFHPYPGWWTRSGVTMQLMVLAPHGAAEATLAQREAAFKAVPRDPLAQLEAEVAKRYFQETPGEPSDDVYEEIFALYEDYYESYLRERLDDAKRDVHVAQYVIPHLFFIHRHLLPHRETDRIDDPLPPIREIATRTMEDVNRECITQHRLGPAMFLLGMARELAILGDSATSQRVLQALDQCLRWEAEFSSEITDKQSWPDAPPYWFGQDFERELAVSSAVTLDARDEWTLWSRGNAPLDYYDATYKGVETYTNQGSTNCPNYTITISLAGTTQGNLDASLRIDLNTYQQWDGLPPERDTGRTSVLLLDVGHSGQSPTEQVTRTHSCNGPTTGDARTWHYVMDRLYRGKVEEYVDGEFEIPFGAVDQRGDVLATRSWDAAEPYTCTSCTGGRTVFTEIELRHRPGR